MSFLSLYILNVNNVSMLKYVRGWLEIAFVCKPHRLPLLLENALVLSFLAPLPNCSPAPLSNFSHSLRENVEITHLLAFLHAFLSHNGIGIIPRYKASIVSS